MRVGGARGGGYARALLPLAAHLAAYLVWVEAPGSSSAGARWGDPPGMGPSSHPMDVRGALAFPPLTGARAPRVALGAPVLGGLGADALAGSPGALVVAGIVRDEGPYLAEWVAFHACVAGARHVLLVDHGSGEERSARVALREEAARGLVTVFEVDGGVRNPQVGAYNALLEVARRAGAAWVAFLDADEFLYAPGQAGRGAVAARLATAFATAPAVAVHWYVYGTSGLASLGGEQVVGTLRRRARGADAGFKSIVRPEAVGAMHVHGPSRMTRPGWLPVDERFLPVQRTDPDGARGPGRRLGPPPGDALRVNHYRLKSREDVRRRWARGGVNLDGHDALSPRGDAEREAFVARWDANDVRDEGAWNAFRALCSPAAASGTTRKRVE